LSSAKDKSPTVDGRAMFKMVKAHYMRLQKVYEKRGLTAASTRTRATAARAGNAERYTAEPWKGQ